MVHNKTIKELVAEFDRNEEKYARRQKIVTMIAQWANEFFADTEEPFELMHERWSKEADALGLQLPSDDDVCNAINDQACNAARFFSYFEELFLAS